MLVSRLGIGTLLFIAILPPKMRSLWLLRIPFRIHTLQFEFTRLSFLLIRTVREKSTVHYVSSSAQKWGWGCWWSAMRISKHYAILMKLSIPNFIDEWKQRWKWNSLEKYMSSSMLTQHCPSRVENKFIAHARPRHVTFHPFTYDYFFLAGFHFPSYTRMFESLILSKNASPTYAIRSVPFMRFWYSNLVWTEWTQWRKKLKIFKITTAESAASVAASAALELKSRASKREREIWMPNSEFTDQMIHVTMWINRFSFNSVNRN